MRANLLGNRYGRLLVESEAPNPGRRLWLCRCDCGHAVKIATGNLTSGDRSSCGCTPSRGTTRHGYNREHARSKEYNAWAKMLERCQNPKASHYENYGGRGISVCDHWRKDFCNFLADMGDCPSSDHSLDRINNDGNYEHSNCRWATRKQQSRNKTNTLRMGGVPLIDLCEQVGVKYATAVARMKRGLPLEKILSTSYIRAKVTEVQDGA